MFLILKKRFSRVAAYVVTFALSGFVCYQLGYNYITSPIVVSVEEVDKRLVGSNFPAITICNIRKWLAKGSQVFELICQDCNFISCSFLTHSIYCYFFYFLFFFAF